MFDSKVTQVLSLASHFRQMENIWRLDPMTVLSISENYKEDKSPQPSDSTQTISQA